MPTSKARRGRERGEKGRGRKERRGERKGRNGKGTHSGLHSVPQLFCGSTPMNVDEDKPVGKDVRTVHKFAEVSR